MIDARGRRDLTAVCHVFVAVLEAGVADADGALALIACGRGVRDRTRVARVGVGAPGLRVVHADADGVAGLLILIASARARSTCGSRSPSHTCSTCDARSTSRTGSARPAARATGRARTTRGAACTAGRARTTRCAACTAGRAACTAGAACTARAARAAGCASRTRTRVVRELVVVVRAARPPGHERHHQAQQRGSHQNVPCTVTDPGPKPTWVVGCSWPESLESKYRAVPAPSPTTPTTNPTLAIVW